MAAQIETLLQNLPQDEAERRKIYEAARRLQHATESDWYMKTRLTHIDPVCMVMSKCALDLGVFADLSHDPHKTWSLQELAAKYHASPLILGRILRALVTFGCVGQPAVDTFQANNKTIALSQPDGSLSIQFFDTFNRSIVKGIPGFLAKTNYQATSDSHGHCAANVGLNIENTLFQYAGENPAMAALMLNYMKHWRDGRPTAWDNRIELSDFKMSNADVQSNRVLMVDVGGGSGHEMVNFRQKHPELPGRLVVEDLEHQINLVDQDEYAKLGIEAVAHDFTKPQPVKGAKVYFLRHIMHDWSDTICQTILGHLRDAMADDSVIVFDEMVVPETNVSELTVGMDITMMSIGSQERTVAEYEALLKPVGLKIRRILTYDDYGPWNLIIVERA